MDVWNDLCRSATSCHGIAKRGGRAARRAGLGQARPRRADGRDPMRPFGAAMTSPGMEGSAVIMNSVLPSSKPSMPAKQFLH